MAGSAASLLSPNCRRESVAGSIKVTRTPRSQGQLLHSLRRERKRKTRNRGATCFATRLVAIDERSASRKSDFRCGFFGIIRLGRTRATKCLQKKEMSDTYF